jgi:hypothetical protein
MNGHFDSECLADRLKSGPWGIVLIATALGGSKGLFAGLCFYFFVVGEQLGEVQRSLGFALQFVGILSIAVCFFARDWFPGLGALLDNATTAEPLIQEERVCGRLISIGRSSPLDFAQSIADS